jgi:hypothetical protein
MRTRLRDSPAGKPNAAQPRAGGRAEGRAELLELLLETAADVLA